MCRRGENDGVHAWIVDRPGPLDSEPAASLSRSRYPTPVPASCLVRISCAVSAEPTSTSPRATSCRAGTGSYPGTKSSGTSTLSGRASPRFEVGARVGIAWLRRHRRYLSLLSQWDGEPLSFTAFTGWDANGGYAEFAVVPEAFAYAIPERFSDAEAAPLLCSGIIGYRALKRAALPPGGSLGIYGFGGSAHLAAQVAMAQGATVHVMTRSEAAQQLRPRTRCRVRPGLRRSLRPSRSTRRSSSLRSAPWSQSRSRRSSAAATCSIAGIYLTDIPPLDYERHLFYEKNLHERDGEHAGRRRGVPRRGGGDRDSRRRHAVPARSCRPGARRPRQRPLQGAAVLVSAAADSSGHLGDWGPIF